MTFAQSRRHRDPGFCRGKRSSDAAHSLDCRDAARLAMTIQLNAIMLQLEHWRDTTGVPDYRLFDSPTTVKLWMNAIGKLPD